MVPANMFVVRLIRTRPPPPPPPWIGSPAPPLTVIVPVPCRDSAVIQILPPAPPPERLFVALEPLTVSAPFNRKLPPATSWIAPPPALPGPPVPLPPPAPRVPGTENNPFADPPGALLELIPP